MKAGFRGVIVGDKGTAAGAFSGFPTSITVGGKTGTAQVNNKQDTSLFVGFAPVDNPTYVAVAVVEEAGWGASTAAPIVRHVFEGAYGIGQSTVGFTPSPGGAN
jgi:penicillin-binding protein 2